MNGDGTCAPTTVVAAIASSSLLHARIIIPPLFESLIADIRFALRWLWKSPGFTLVAVLSLAIGIGFNTTLFTIVDALLFKPLPVKAADRLVDVFTNDSTGTSTFSTSSYPDYLDIQSQQRRVRGHGRLQPDVRGAEPRQPIPSRDG